jgi:hypothetical protein
MFPGSEEILPFGENREHWRRREESLGLRRLNVQKKREQQQQFERDWALKLSN